MDCLGFCLNMEPLEGLLPSLPQTAEELGPTAPLACSLTKSWVTGGQRLEDLTRIDRNKQQSVNANIP